MRQKCKFWLVALAFLSLFTISFPMHALAQAADPCPQNNAMDKLVAQNQQAHAQDLFNRAHNINQMFPISPAANACVQKIKDIFETISTLSASTSGLGGIVEAAITSAINGMIDQLILGACQAALSTIQSAEASISSLLKVCVPLPSFSGNLGLQFPQFPCPGSQLSFGQGGGSAQFSLMPGPVTGAPPPKPPQPYDYLGQINNLLK